MLPQATANIFPDDSEGGSLQKRYKTGFCCKYIKKGKLKARKGGKVKVTVILKSGKKSTCTVRIKVPKKKKSSGHGGTVYWTPYGSVYHVSRNCPTLSRSRTIYSGSISESGKSRCCKVCG